MQPRDVRIERLPDGLVDQIAAGEVVERPASVLRELLDNAVDAGATRINVEVRVGGVERLAVRDDGHGIPAAEVSLALERHATSKIRRIDDLLEVRTLGFRGEALPSIASVSRFRMTSRPHDALAGVQLEVTGGVAAPAREVGAPPGTSVEVEDLFFNVPARRKFLRTRRTESARLFSVLHRLALCHPSIHLVLHEDGREQLNLPPVPDARQRLAAVFGRPNAARLTPLERRGSLVRVHGFLSPPDLSRSTAAGLHLFVNGRSIRDRGLLGALRGGYRGLLEGGRFPLGVLFLELDPSLVDVNVHPQKAEVRFREEGAVRGALVASVREFLAAAPWLGAGGGQWDVAALAWPRPSLASDGAAPGGGAPGYSEGAQRLKAALGRFGRAPGTGAGAGAAPDPEQVWLPGPASAGARGPDGISWGRDAPAGAASPGPALGPDPREALADPSAAPDPAATGFFGRLRLLGQVGATFLACEGPRGLVVIDQHAAHERVTFERLRAAHGAGSIPSQAYLVPERVELSPQALRVLEEQLELLATLGFEVEPFGGGSVLVKAIPAVLVGADPGPLLEELASSLDEGQARSRPGPAAGPLQERLEAIWATMACHGSVRAGQRLSTPEQRALLVALDAVDFQGNCPHGRPVATEIPLPELEQRMKRR